MGYLSHIEIGFSFFMYLEMKKLKHDSTGEKPSFLLYGVDCRSPTEAALMPPSDATVKDLDIADYREQVVMTLSSARETAVQARRKAQGRYKRNYDKKAKCLSFKVGERDLERMTVKQHQGNEVARKLAHYFKGTQHLNFLMM